MPTPSQSSLLEGAPDYEAAFDRAGRWLALRARTEAELTGRLEEGGFDPAVVTRVIARLKELRLVDDAAFARAWVEERTRRKASGPALLKEELAAKGVADEVIAEVLDQAFPDEATRATELAAGLVGKWAELPVAKQVARLSGALARKGFSPEAVEAGVRAVLPPEGWD